jgi:hypothetical protein
MSLSGWEVVFCYFLSFLTRQWLTQGWNCVSLIFLSPLLSIVLKNKVSAIEYMDE